MNLNVTGNNDDAECIRFYLEKNIPCSRRIRTFIPFNELIAEIMWQMKFIFEYLQRRFNTIAHANETESVMNMKYSKKRKEEFDLATKATHRNRRDVIKYYFVANFFLFSVRHCSIIEF